MTDACLTWLTTYLLHSTLLLGALALAERGGALRRLGTATREALWRLALLGGLLSASLPLLLPSMRTVPAWPGPAPAALGPQATQSAPRPAPVQVPAPAPVPTAPAPATDPAALQAAVGGVVLPMARGGADAHALLLAGAALWLVGALGALAWLGLEGAWLRRTVARLPAVTDGRWRRLAAEAAAAAGVRAPSLRGASPWASPLLAPGAVLCLPAWCLGLADDEARAVLGHEMAHLRRRDPAWRLVAALLRAIGWPQPLNRLAARRLDGLAELACDAAVGTAAGQREALAQSLLRCAQAQRGRRHAPPALACGAGGGGSALRDRIRHLLAPAGAAPADRRGLRWALGAAVLATVLLLPAVVVRNTRVDGWLDGIDASDWVADVQEHLRAGSGPFTRVHSDWPGGSFHASLAGAATFNEAEDDVAALTGTLTVRERGGGAWREMQLTGRPDGGVARDYRVGGQPAPLDDAARQWWGRAVRRLAEALVDPRARAARRFTQGGIEAVLADVDGAPQDDGRRRRIDAALTLPEAALGGQVSARLIASAAGIAGGFDRREALRAIARLPLDDARQQAWLAAAAGIDGDYDRREAMAALAPQLSPSPPVLRSWEQALARIDDGHELRAAIQTQLASVQAPALLLAALKASERLRGDADRREVLGDVARRFRGDEAELVSAYLGSAAGIAGAYEKREALTALLDREALTPAGVDQVLGVAEGIAPGFDRQQVLLRAAARLAARRPVDPGLVDRLRRGARGMGEFERGQLETALDAL